jgi:hypothetical protein
MNYIEIELEFERIFSLPLWKRPIEVAMLAKIHGIPTPDLRKSFALFCGQKYRERRSES